MHPLLLCDRAGLFSMVPSLVSYSNGVPFPSCPIHSLSIFQDPALFLPAQSLSLIVLPISDVPPL